MTSFRVPRADQQKVLLFGIVFSLIARTGFILVGAALINQFASVFYLFGLVLLLTAGNMVKPEGEDSHSADNILIRLARRLFHTTDTYDGDKLFTVENGRRVKALPEKYRRHIREEQKLLDLIARAHAVHDERVRDAG